MSDTDSTQDNTQDEPNSTTKGRVRRISKKEQNTETNNTANNNLTNDVDDTDTDDTDTDDTDTNEPEGVASTTTTETANDETDETLQAHAEHVATGILEGVLAQSGIVNTVKDTDNLSAKKLLSRRDLAAARARQMRLNMAREFMQAGKLLNARQRLFDILDSAPNSPEADAAIELLLELAAHYESLGQTRWALDLYDDIARYD